VKRPLILLLILSLAVPVLFLGCSGDDGSTGSAGAPGAPGAPGDPGDPGDPGPGAQANETCVLCHNTGRIADLVTAHAASLPENQGTVSNPTTINSVTFGAPVGDNVPVSVTFTFEATNSAGVDITGSIDLRTGTTDLTYVRFGLAKLVAGTNGGSDDWNGYIVNPAGSGTAIYLSRVAGRLTGTPATGVYTYTFPDNAVRVSDGYVDNVVHRVAIQLSGFPAGSFNPDTTVDRPVGNITADMVNPIGGGTLNSPFSVGAGYPSKDVVTTAACNECHDPLALHGGGRRETKFCVVCHNAKLETAAGGSYDNGNLVNLVHKIHTAQDLGAIFDASEVTYPILIENPSPFGVINPKLGIRDVRNCSKCHKGLDGLNWNTRPTRAACGSCHVKVNFATGQGHSGANFAQADDSGCAVSFCHGSAALQPSFVHRTENVTPNNPLLPGTLSAFEYGIDNVTVDSTNVATVKFWIKKDGVFQNLGAVNDNITRPSGFSSGPSFLLAWALPQDGVTTPADYNNLKSPAVPDNTTGNGAGQPPSVSIIGLKIEGFDNVTKLYTVKVPSRPFPAGAKMRAVALQGYFAQDVNNTPTVTTDDIGRHTPSVVFQGVWDTSKSPPVRDAQRRTVVKSGYVDNILKPVPVPVTDPALFSTAQPWGCLECHEIFEGHGGNRVNNVQVCVMCHNPNLSSSGRTLLPPIDNDVTAVLGSDPLTYPEATNNMKSLIHGIHAAPIREPDNPFKFVRNRSTGFFYDWSEVTYPGTLNNCQKCHNGVTYDPDLPAGQLLSTERTTLVNPGQTETRAQIITARGNPTTLGTMNTTDLVNTPIAAACVYCHDSSAAQSHFVLNGASLFSTRAEALLGP